MSFLLSRTRAAGIVELQPDPRQAIQGSVQLLPPFGGYAHANHFHGRTVSRHFQRLIEVCAYTP